MTLVDTAGLRDGADAIERIGVSRARERAEAADLVLWLSEGETPPRFACPVWPIEPKADLRACDPEQVGASGAMAISAKTGLNLDRLVERLGTFSQDLARTGAGGLLARARHKRAFEGALAALAHAQANGDLPLELLAEDLRAARFALDRLIGSVDVEDILGDIFSRFCIGK